MHHPELRIACSKRTESPLYSGLVGRAPATLEKRIPINGGNVVQILCPTTCSCDLDGNGYVDTGDVALVLLDYGPCQGTSLTTPQEPLILQSIEPATPVLNKK